MISGIGTREYYRRLGYVLTGTYMVKDLGAIKRNRCSSLVVMVLVILVLAVLVGAFRPVVDAQVVNAQGVHEHKVWCLGVI